MSVVHLWGFEEAPLFGLTFSFYQPFPRQLYLFFFVLEYEGQAAIRFVTIIGGIGFLWCISVS